MRDEAHRLIEEHQELAERQLNVLFQLQREKYSNIKRYIITTETCREAGTGTWAGQRDIQYEVITDK